MRVGVRSYYSVDRPPVKFHRIRSSFDAPTDNYSDIIVGQRRTFSVSENSRRASISLLPSQSRHSPPSPSSYPSSRPEPSDAIARSENPLCAVHRTPRARPEVVPNPTRTVVTVGLKTSPDIYKTSPFSYLISLACLSETVRLRSEGPDAPKLSLLLYIDQL